MLLPSAQPHSFNMIQVHFDLRMDIWMNGIKITGGDTKREQNNGKYIKWEFPLVRLWCLSTVITVTIEASGCRSPCAGYTSLCIIINTTLSTSHRCHSGATSLSNIKPCVMLIHAYYCYTVLTIQHLKGVIISCSVNRADIKTALSYNMFPHACQSSPQRICFCEQMIVLRC